jgi:hypothetical protein
MVADARTGKNARQAQSTQARRQVRDRRAVGASLSLAAGACRLARDFGKLIADETEKWAKVIKAANVKPE